MQIWVSEMSFTTLCIIFYVTNLAIAAVIPQEQDAIILRYDFQNNGRGSYKFSYETSNGIKRDETGQIVNDNHGNEHIAVHGVYSYTDPDGKTRLYKYTADESGYHVILVDSTSRPRTEDTQFFSPPVQFSGQSAVVASLLGK